MEGPLLEAHEGDAGAFVMANCRHMTCSDMAAQLKRHEDADSIVTIKVSFVPCGNEGVRAVEDFIRSRSPSATPLLSLTLQGCGLTSKCTPDLCRLISSLSDLQTICLGDNEFTDDALDELSSAIATRRTLTYLNMGGNKKLTDAALADFSECTRSLPSLCYLILRGTEAGPLTFNRLADLDTLKALLQFQLRCVHIDAKTALALTRLFPQLTSLRMLGLQNVMLTGDVAVGLLQPLMTAHTELQTLVLSCNPLGNGITGAVSKLLRTNAGSKLTSLMIRRCELTSTDAIAVLAAGVKASATLTALDVSENAFKSPGVRALCDAIPHCPTLKNVSLATVMADADAVDALCETMKICPHVDMLDFSSNFSGDKGCLLWCKFLDSPECTIQKLVLTDNEVSEEHCTLLAKCVLRNEVLRDGNFGGQSSKPPQGNKMRLEYQKAIRQHFANNAQRRARAADGHELEPFVPTPLPPIVPVAPAKTAKGPQRPTEAPTHKNKAPPQAHPNGPPPFAGHPFAAAPPPAPQDFRMPPHFMPPFPPPFPGFHQIPPPYHQGLPPPHFANSAEASNAAPWFGQHPPMSSPVPGTSIQVVMADSPSHAPPIQVTVEIPDVYSGTILRTH